MITEIFVGIFIITGSLLCVITSIGLIRFPDLLTRMHAMSITSTVGASCLLIAVGIASADVSIIARVVMAIIFLFITVPVSSHLLARSACFSDVYIWRGTGLNEYRTSKNYNEHKNNNK